jgi:hypothetical protein
LGLPLSSTDDFLKQQLKKAEQEYKDALEECKPIIKERLLAFCSAFLKKYMANKPSEFFSSYKEFEEFYNEDISDKIFNPTRMDWWYVVTKEDVLECTEGHLLSGMRIFLLNNIK